jgi:hypothetical protein
VGYVNHLGQDLRWVHPQQAPPTVTIHDLFEQNLIQTCSLVLRRERLPAIPEWFLDLRLGDWPLVILLAETGPIGLLPQVMACYRQHAQGAWSQRNPVFHLQSIITMLVELDRHTDGRHAAELRKSRDRVLEKAFEELDKQQQVIADYRTSWSFRLGWALTNPVRLLGKLLGSRGNPARPPDRTEGAAARGSCL